MSTSVDETPLPSVESDKSLSVDEENTIKNI